MLGLILRQIAVGKGLGQSQRLLQAQADPFSRNGVDRTRGVASQRYLSAINIFQPPRSRDRPTFHCYRLRSVQSRQDFRKAVEGLIQAQVLVS
jgi:hypothetical protein